MLNVHLKKLQSALIKLKPTGPGGFEGLVATALADLTGLTFRLAKSGSQFGRDASTPRAQFAIAMEAKRFTESLRLEDVAGKIWIASLELESDIDLWVLCATSEMGDGGLAKLEQMLEDRGISLLMLDWTGAPIPRLAVLLAAARTKVDQWCAAHECKAAATIDAALALIEADLAFGSARDQLKNEAGASYVGLAALAEANVRWCERVFSDRLASRSAFGQYLTVSDPAFPSIARTTVEAALATALRSPLKTPGCVAILGPEGCGKSWLAARAWLNASNKPILIVGGAQTAHLIDPKNALKTLASLIAAQYGSDSNVETARWLRRLERWRSHSVGAETTAMRFLLLLDGLNERSGMSWAEIIVGVSVEVQKLGGQLLLTCRQGFWEREVVPRLQGVTVDRLHVGNYTNQELAAVLRLRGIDSERIPVGVRKSLQNPRICSVAVAIIDRLSPNLEELTVARLLMEYWKRRLEERGDQIAHNDRDFENLIRSHAKRLRNDIDAQFDRDDWHSHSGAAKRQDGRSLHHDLTEIEEGAFLRPVDERAGFYEFKPEIAPFALGLLIARELQDEVQGGERSPVEVIDSILEELKGLELVAEALRNAADIACSDAKFPREGRAVIIIEWLSLQNVPESGFDSLVACASVCPEAVLDAIVVAFDKRLYIAPREWLIAAIDETRHRQRVGAALQPRIAEWLSRWSRMPIRLGSRDQREEARVLEAAQRTSNRLKALTPIESTFLSRVCKEVESPESMRIDMAAAHFLAGQPQAEFAEGVLAWSFVRALTGDFQGAHAALSWAIRLNQHDFDELEIRLGHAVDEILNTEHSEVGRSAAAIALRLLGTLAGSDKADQLEPLPARERWRIEERYCQSDPYDPQALRPKNIVNAIREAGAINPADVWLSMGTGKKDLELEWITAGMARFESDVIVRLYRQIVVTIQSRTDLALRQLSWHLQSLSPLFDETTLGAVLSGYRRLLQQPELIAAPDHRHVAGSILLSLLPHFEASRQLELYQELPIEVADWDAFREVFAALNSVELEAALAGVWSDPIKLRRCLCFASAHPAQLTQRARELVGRALQHPDYLIVTYASELAYLSRDAQLDELVIEAAHLRGKGADTGDDAFWRARAVAAAVVTLARVEDVPLVAPRFLRDVEERLELSGPRRVSAAIELAIHRLLGPVEAIEPQMGRVFLDVGREGDVASLRVEDRAKQDYTDPVESLRAYTEAMSEQDQGVDETFERRRALQDEADAYVVQLTAEDAQALAREPDMGGLRLVVVREPDRADEWARRIIAEKDQRRLSTVRNLALGLVETMAESNPERAATLLAHVATVRSPISIARGIARVPQDICALFSGPDTESLAALRSTALEESMSDSEIEMLVFAAETAGHATWLHKWIDREVASGTPGRIARALTAGGLCNGPSPFLWNDWGSGFLGEVAGHARRAFDRNVWARGWAQQLVQAADAVDFWRWGNLTSGIADIRANHWFDVESTSPLMRRFGREVFVRIQKASEKRSKKREKTLFGLRRPDREMSELLSAKRVFRGR